MSTPRFIADQNFRGEIIRGLRRQEPVFPIHEAREIGLAASPDKEILEIAARQGEIVLTHDSNTMIRLAIDRIASGKPMPGLVVTPQRPGLIGKIIDGLLALWACSEAEEWHDKIIYLPFKQ